MYLRFFMLQTLAERADLQHNIMKLQHEQLQRLGQLDKDRAESGELQRLKNKSTSEQSE